MNSNACHLVLRKLVKRASQISQRPANVDAHDSKGLSTLPLKSAFAAYTYLESFQASGQWRPRDSKYGQRNVDEGEDQSSQKMWYQLRVEVPQLFATFQSRPLLFCFPTMDPKCDL